MSYKERLAGMQEKAKEQLADYKPGGNFSIPDNDYLMRVTAAIEETKKAPPRLTVVWLFVVADGELEGRQVYDRTIIEDNQVGLQICRGRIETLGYEWPEDNLRQLEDIIEDITKRAPSLTVRARSKDNGEYVNTRITIREVHEMPEQAPAMQEAAAGVVDENQNSGLLEFCVSQGIDGVNAKMTVEDIVQGIKDAKFTFKEEEITAEEKNLLDQVGLGDSVIKKPVSVEKAAPAALKKAAPALAKKPLSKKKGK